jgi:Rod binding domain-containing protein
MFTAMLDEHFADALPAQWSRGIAGALMQDLAGPAPQPPADAEAR